MIIIIMIQIFIIIIIIIYYNTVYLYIYKLPINRSCGPVLKDIYVYIRTYMYV